MAETLCQLCLFKSEPMDEICMEESQFIEQIISDIFQKMISLTRLQIDGICMPCRSKLKSFHEYYKFVLENQKTLAAQIVTFDVPSSTERPEFVEVVKKEDSEGKEDEKPMVKFEQEMDEDEDYVDDVEEVDEEPPKKLKQKSSDPDYDPVIDKKQLKRDSILPKSSNKKTNFHKASETDRRRKRKRDTRARPDTIEKWRAANETILESKLFDYVCRKCPEPKEFATYETISEHSRKWHRMKRHVWKCSKPISKSCERELTVRGDLLAHIEEHKSGPKWDCKDCGQVFSNGREYRTHWSKTHRKCDICKLSKITKETYFSHMQRHLLSKVPGKLARYTCDLCKKTLTDRYGLKKHMENFHLGLTRHVCEICGINSVTQSALTVHIQNMHSKEETPKIPCRICGYMLKNRKNAIDGHMKYNHGTQQPMPCTICGEMIRHERAMKDHMRRRHAEKRHKCPHCNKAFHNRRQMNDHVAVHTGQPQYFCEFCEAQFKSSGNFLAHKRRLHPEQYKQQKAATLAKKFQ